MASSISNNSLRRKSYGPYYSINSNGVISKLVVMRPGKTAEDKRVKSWMSKWERNNRQASYRGE